MIANENLVEAYDSWERWTQREGLAIQAGNWRLVSECQKAKLELQGHIIRLTEAARSGRTEAGLASNDFAENLGRIVNGLITLETRNANLLAAHRQSVSSQLAELSHASCNLKRVQKSYGQPSPAAWHSYS